MYSPLKLRREATQFCDPKFPKPLLRKVGMSAILELGLGLGLRLGLALAYGRHVGNTDTGVGLSVRSEG